jgi:hypothetical protein
MTNVNTINGCDDQQFSLVDKVLITSMLAGDALGKSNISKDRIREKKRYMKI